MDITDKRAHAHGTSVPNRVRLMRRVKGNLRRIVDEALKGKAVITGSGDSKEVSVPVDGIEEPFIHKSNRGGNRHYVLPGNEEFVEGDLIERPKGGGGDGSGSNAGRGDSLDSFRFVISREEFLELLFEDCELPNLRKQHSGQTDLFVLRRAGFSKSGSPSQMDLVRTMRYSLGRRIALGRPKQDELAALEAAIEAEEARGESELLLELREQLARLQVRYLLIPFIEPDHDVRYRRFEKTPKPITQAVMFCLMDVSGSMSEEQKNIAKRFYLLLKAFLENRYKRVELVFIRHTDKAKEVDEETFFYSQESGGTVVSTALEEMRRILRERYSGDWNVYAAQASDGDNDRSDTSDVMALLAEILPLVQFYAYIEVGDGSRSTTLWDAYDELEADNFAMEQVTHPNEIIKVFYRLFGRGASH